jgi:DNA transformation protein
MSRDVVDHCLELLAPLGAVRARRMFGGHGLYCDELFFALIASNRLYLKADAQSRPAFECAGCEPFIYQAAGRFTSIGYWTVPAEAMESAAQMQTWARLALAAALRARAAKLPAAPRKARAALAQTQAGNARRKR